VNVISMQEYRDRKALSVEASAGIFVGMTVLMLVGAVFVWWEWWLG
jgi:hypothetical protein